MTVMPDVCRRRSDWLRAPLAAVTDKLSSTLRSSLKENGADRNSPSHQPLTPVPPVRLALASLATPTSISGYSTGPKGLLVLAPPSEAPGVWTLKHFELEPTGFLKGSWDLRHGGGDL